MELARVDKWLNLKQTEVMEEEQVQGGPMLSIWEQDESRLR